MTQDLRSLGLQGTIGMGFSGLSGLGAEYRGLAPAGSYADDISSEYIVLGVNVGAGFQLTDRLSVGRTATLGTGIEQLALVSTPMVHDYGLRGTIGLNYAMDDCNTLGAFYQSRLDFQFPTAIPNPLAVGPAYFDLNLDQPDTFGLGYANRSLLDGNLLIAADVYYKLWQDAAGYQDIFVNQWAFAVGTQLTQGKLKYRFGYSYNTDPINHSVGSQLEGHPIGKDAIQFLQASTTGVINQHRITGGIGREDFLFTGLDLDLFAGGLLPASEQFGHTSEFCAMYYVGMGLTWRFNATPSQPEPSADQFLEKQAM